MRSTVKRNKERQEVSAAGNAWRKEKPNQRKITNVAGNAWRNKTKHAAERNRINLLRQEQRGRQTQAGYRAPPTCTQPIQGRWAHGQGDSEGVVWWWGKRGSIFGFLPWLLLEIYLARIVSYPKEVINGWDHLMHAIELGSEVAQSLFSHLEVEVYRGNKQKGILSWNE